MGIWLRASRIRAPRTPDAPRPTPETWRPGRRVGYGLVALRTGLGLVVLALLSVEGVAGPLRLPRWWPLQGLAVLAGIDAVFCLLTRWRREPRPGAAAACRSVLLDAAGPVTPGAPPVRQAGWRYVNLEAAQVAADLLLVSALIYLTGGPGSAFAFLPFACVLTAAVVLGGYVSLFYASLATVLLALVSTAYSLAYLGLLHLPWVTPSWVATLRPTLPRTLATVATQGLALHLVAFLGGNLATRLKRETNLKEEILEHLREGLIVVDAAHRVAFVNAEAVSLLGFQWAHQLVGRRWEDVFRRRGDRQVRQMLSGDLDASGPGPACPSPRARVIEFAHREKGKLYLSVRVNPFRPTTTSRRSLRRRDTLGGVVAIVHDITAEKTMAAVQERAERLQEISLVAAGIAHELRNPLTTIRGCVQELARLETKSAKSRRLADIVTRETDRLDKIITEFLDFARMRPPRPVPVDLHALIEEAVVLLQAGRGLDRVEVETDVPADLRLAADRDQLKQVLLNLARNAVDAMTEGGRLAIAAARVPRMPGRGPHEPDVGAVRIEVADTGCGIPPEHIDSLFTPFFTTKANGTGLGLSIVDRIVRSHEGHLEVESQLGSGSTFRLWLPAAERRLVAPPPSGARAHPGAGVQRPPAPSAGRERAPSGAPYAVYDDGLREGATNADPAERASEEAPASAQASPARRHRPAATHEE